ncbi:MAG: hypothetical protein KatS3mg050_4554 [Litorilinea sp.]|nr:MAG: hypothetical protein KatS3mg050_4554 [Litorilinea sp.]
MKHVAQRTEVSNPSARYLPEIVARLRQMDPARIILFGSQASDEADQDSDLDLIVVTNSEEMPSTYRERQDIYLQVARLLRDIRREISIDLIVHTRPMHARFIAMDSAFSREVQQKGVVLYESHHPRMAG